MTRYAIRPNPMQLMKTLGALPTEALLYMVVNKLPQLF